MRGTITRIALCAVIVGVMLVHGPAAATEQPSGATLIVESGDELTQVGADGRFVVWSVNTGSAEFPREDVYARDLVTGETIPVAVGPDGHSFCSVVDGRVAVWGRNPDDPDGVGNYLYDLYTRETTSVGPGGWGWYCPVIAGERMAYTSYDFDTSKQSLWVRDIGPESVPVLIAEVIGANNIRGVGFDGETVVWFQRICCADGLRPERWQLRAQRVDQDQSVVLDEGWEYAWASVLGASVFGDLVVSSPLSPVRDESQYPDYFLRLMSLTTRAVERVPQPSAEIGCYPWAGADADSLWGRCGMPDEYWALERDTNSLFAMDVDPRYPGPGDYPLPLSGTRSGETIVWISQEAEDSWVIWSMAVDEVSPSAYRAAPPVDDPRFYFPETGHVLSLGWRFWEANGGLAVFGYPLTETFVEKNRDTGEWYSVQFTERQRFEWHPENAGTPYEVLLGRLGHEQAERAGLLSSEPFLYRGDDEGPDAGCLYFRETGHYVCDAFRFYWQEHGLDLGDPGVSYRESLALFGYPISEPFMTTNADGHTVLTQYFERAVFELHPQNPTPWKVLLRRLGAEALTERGW